MITDLEIFISRLLYYRLLSSQLIYQNILVPRFFSFFGLSCAICLISLISIMYLVVMNSLKGPGVSTLDVKIEFFVVSSDEILFLAKVIAFIEPKNAYKYIVHANINRYLLEM